MQHAQQKVCNPPFKEITSEVRDDSDYIFICVQSSVAITGSNYIFCSNFIARFHAHALLRKVIIEYLRKCITKGAILFALAIAFLIYR